jgi:HK97 family phage portal protein
VPNPGRTLAGVVVTPDTAITIAAVWAAIRYLSQTVAVLPWHVKKDGKNGPEIQSSHGVDYLLWKRPSKEWSSFQFRETLTHWALRWGNGIAEIEPDQLGRPYAMWPIHPSRVRFCRADEPEQDAYGTVIEAGDLFYEIDSANGRRITLAAANVFHLRGFGEGPVGVNVMTMPPSRSAGPAPRSCSAPRSSATAPRRRRW